MKRKLVIISISLIVSALIAIGSCSDEKSPVGPPESKPVICPLASGNVWNYVDTIWIGGPPVDTTSYIEITGDTTVMVDNIDYDVFYMVMGDPMNPETSTMYVRNEANGFWNLGVPCVTDTMTFRNMVAMYPATVGATWTKGWFFCVMGSIMGTGPGISECIRVDTLYTTPAGTFECYHFHEVYNTPYGSVEYDLFMAPNIGIVGLEAQSSMVTSKKVLSSRSLK